MVVWLSDDVYIQANDGVCFELMRRYRRKHGKNEGQWTQKPLAYHASLEACARAALNNAVLGSKETKNVAELVKFLEVVSKQIVSACETAATASQAASISAAFTPEELERLTFFEEAE